MMAQVLVSMDSDEEGVLQQLKELDELASMMKMDESRGNDDYEDEDEDEGTEEETADAILKELEELDRIATGTQGYEEYTRDKDEDGEGLAHNRDLDHDELKELRRLIQKRELLKEKLRILKKREMLQNKLKELERQKREALRRRAEHEASSPHSRESTPMEDSSIIEADLGFKTRGWNNEIKFEKANLDDSTSPEHSLIGIEHDYFNQSVDCLSGRIFRKAVGKVVRGIATSVTRSQHRRSLDDSGYGANASHLLSFEEQSSEEKSPEEVQALMNDLLDLEVSVLNDSIESETKELEALPSLSSPSPSRRREGHKEKPRGQDEGSDKTASLLAELAELDLLSQKASQARKSLNTSLQDSKTNIMKPQDGWSKVGGAASPVDVVTLC